jgi:glyoxylase-like metal-dependent hydrolase (beta-lactamase superfamily II)
MRIGSMVLTGLVDGQMRLWADAIYPRVSASDWSRHQHLLVDDGIVRMSLGGFLVRGIGERTVLIDAGAGPRFDLPSALGQVVTCGLMPGQLASLGVAPADITDVVFSHLHHDHVGWASVDGEPFFPNATYWCHELDWCHFMESAGDKRVVSALEPVRDQVELWSLDFTLVPGIELSFSPGHTPGSVCIFLATADEMMALIGDVAHNPIELLIDIPGPGDLDPHRASLTRTFILQRIRANSWICGSHFPDLQCGVIANGGSQWLWGPCLAGQTSKRAHAHGE